MKHNILFAPCPFCGGTKFHFSDRDFFEEQVEKTGSFCVGMECKACDLEMHVFKQTDYDEAIKELMWKWNRRECGNVNNS